MLVLASGGGTNLQALIDAAANGEFGGSKIAAVLSDRADAYALQRARAAGIPAVLIETDPGQPREERRIVLSDFILRYAQDKKIGLVIHAGFLWILKGRIVDEYPGRMINIHPALLPKFGGKGMYGLNVHRAVLAAGEKESGCSVHLVDSGTDTGRVILQRKVPVLPGDTPEVLAARILAEEHIAIVEAVKMMIKNPGGIK